MLEGIVSSCAAGLFNNYLIPYALILKATAAQIGILSSAPSLAASLVQFKSAEATEWLGGRKKALCIGSFFNTLVFLLILLLPLLFKAQAVWVLIILLTLINPINAIAGLSWTSLMAVYIRGGMFGRYFGWRNRILGIITLICTYIAGFTLNYFKNDIYKGFFIILSVVVALRLASFIFVTQMYEPKVSFKEEDPVGFLAFLGRFRESNFVQFTVSAALFQFSAALAGPFFAVFALRELHFSYIIFTLLTTAPAIVQLLALKRLGEISDKIGSAKVFKFSSLVIASSPLWWMINQNPFYLIFAEMVCGVAWGGFIFSVNNFIYEAVSAQKRIRCFAYYGILTSIAVFCGAWLGGFFMNKLPYFLGYRFFSLTLLASILRFTVAIFLLARIKEARKIPPFSRQELLQAIWGIKS